MRNVIGKMTSNRQRKRSLRVTAALALTVNATIAMMSGLTTQVTAAADVCLSGVSQPLAFTAVAGAGGVQLNWQPPLCSGTGLDHYSISATDALSGQPILSTTCQPDCTGLFEKYDALPGVASYVTWLLSATDTNGQSSNNANAVSTYPALKEPDQTPANGVVSPVPPDNAPDPSGPANLIGGKIASANGVGVSGLTVGVYVEPLGDPSTTPAPDYLGSTLTDSSGGFSFTVPTPLDSYAQNLATLNGGVLNVRIEATVAAALPSDPVSPPILELADGDIPLQVNGPALYWQGVPPIFTLLPVNPSNTTTVLPTGAEFDPTDPSVDGATHYVPTPADAVTSGGHPVSADAPFVVHGINYRNAVPLTAASSSDSYCGTPVLMSVDQIATTDSYVISGESHAYYDTKAGFTYNQQADTDIEVGVSADGGGNWSLGGSVHISNSASVTTGTLDRGPYYGHQQRILFHFRELRGHFRCSANGKEFYRDHAEADHCLFKWLQGSDVSRYDGASAYWNAAPAHRDVLNPGGYLAIAKGHGYGYGTAFNAFGASFGASTTHTTNIEQSISAGTGRYEHDIFGNNANPYSGPNFVYSY